MITLLWLQPFLSTSTELYITTGKITSEAYDFQRNWVKTSEIFAVT